MLRALNIRIDGATRQKLHQSLQYWCELEIRYEDAWHQIETRTPVTKTLPPPLRSARQKTSAREHRVGSRMVRVTQGVLRKTAYTAAWLRRRAKSNSVIRPVNSAASVDVEPDGVDFQLCGYWTKPQSIETRCQKIGLSPTVLGRPNSSAYCPINRPSAPTTAAVVMIFCP